MDIGVTLPTHGLMTRTAGGDAILRNLPAAEMRPVEYAVRAEALGYHSAWLSDHVVTERATTVAHPSNASGARVYPDRPVMLDVVATLGAISSRTTTLRLAPSVYIAPYRHPLNAAHQFATLDNLSGGRLIVGVGVGWETGEFAALGVSYADRGRIIEEAIQVYRAAWTEPWIDFRGEFFDIRDVSMDPKPVQRPHPPIWYGGMSPVAARRAARFCDGFYPMYLDGSADPTRLAPLIEVIRDEAGRRGRDLTGFRLGAFCQVMVTDRPDDRFGAARPPLTGSAEQILHDLRRFADLGYSHITVHFDCPAGTTAEWEEQFEGFGTEILPEAAGITHRDLF
ncbi:TIGR03619 family F420-dependent LLM class oxidoreductase [Actinomadura chibensis]|uniref:TIGR03619 family F420-dependent LLM class oxidoreductase n=1 Tax=Actinomadura chibensis TaxID=392828 RepID=A0A5D0N7G1_9ACTN|nr:TIGR03619 family F420-dependent LLM class oxidoreductase [Actinomadura chibensis]TYB40125.1 TIGR03619 family F420-dependent LLM class oxidoreductase [Actinomadura chibensis]